MHDHDNAQLKICLTFIHFFEYPTYREVRAIILLVSIARGNAVFQMSRITRHPYQIRYVCAMLT